MSATRKRTRLLELSPKAITEFFKPARIEIYDCLRVSGPASIADLAERLGRAPDSLYYHVRKLIQLKVIEQIPDELGGEGLPGRNGAIFGCATDAVTLRLDLKSKANRAAWAGGAASVMRLMTRDIESAIESRNACVEGPERNLLVQRTKTRLNSKELKRVNALVDELYSLLHEKTENTEGQLYSLICAMSPLEERKR